MPESRSAYDNSQPLIVVMGVSGCGKSTVGVRVAEMLRVPFVDADSLHPPENVEKMAAGTPLTDADRAPWLAAVGQLVAAHERDRTGVVVACSALKRDYRETIRAAAAGTYFLQLSGTQAVLSTRLAARSGHFMPSALLESQLAALEPLACDERGSVVDIDASVPSIVATAIANIERHSLRGPHLASGVARGSVRVGRVELVSG